MVRGVAGQALCAIFEVIRTGAALLYAEVGSNCKAGVAGARGVVSAEGGILVAEGADCPRGAEVAVGNPNMALRAGAILEEVAGEAAVAGVGRGTDITARDQEGALGAADAGEAVVGVAACTDCGRGA
jgi:hypothetical protein